jgi:hypothetical protein
MRNSYKILITKTERKKPHRRLGNRLVDLKDGGRKVVKWMLASIPRISSALFYHPEQEAIMCIVL